MPRGRKPKKSNSGGLPGKRKKEAEKGYNNDVGVEEAGVISDLNIMPSFNPQNQEIIRKTSKEPELASNSTKSKVAPRSGAQFRVGPPFNETETHRKFYITSSAEVIIPELTARIDRGFDFIDREWIGYKRNYFTLVAAFQFLGKDESVFYNEKFHIVDDDKEQINIKCFAIRLVSECCENDIKVALVQHTAKRDKGPQYSPPIYPAICGTIPEHELIRDSANIRNVARIGDLNRCFYLPENYGGSEVPNDCILKTYPEGKISTAAKYERMQFTTSLNYRKPALLNRHFVLRVELLAVLEDGRYTILNSIESPHLVVRGRSPSNYKVSKDQTVSKATQPKKDKEKLTTKQEFAPVAAKVEAPTGKKQGRPSGSKLQKKMPISVIGEVVDFKPKQAVKIFEDPPPPSTFSMVQLPKASPRYDYLKSLPKDLLADNIDYSNYPDPLGSSISSYNVGNEENLPEYLKMFGMDTKRSGSTGSGHKHRRSQKSHRSHRRHKSHGEHRIREHRSHGIEKAREHSSHREHRSHRKHRHSKHKHRSHEHQSTGHPLMPIGTEINQQLPSSVVLSSQASVQYFSSHSPAGTKIRPGSSHGSTSGAGSGLTLEPHVGDALRLVPNSQVSN